VYRTYDEATLPLPLSKLHARRCGEEEQVKRALLVLCDVTTTKKKEKKKGIDPVGERLDGSQNPVLA
jgi:hypothetical protein